MSKLPRCVYPDPECCGSAEIKQTFNMLWNALNGKLDLENIRHDIFGGGISVQTQTGRREELEIIWNYGPNSRWCPKFVETPTLGS